MNRSGNDSRPAFTPKQGQYLAFIYVYTLANGRPPADADMMRFFRVTPPTVHQMVFTSFCREHCHQLADGGAECCHHLATRNGETDNGCVLGVGHDDLWCG